MPSFRSPHLVALSPLLSLGLLLDAAAVQAATIHVTTTAPEAVSDGKCSLFEAIQAAEANAAVDACEAGSGLTDTIDIPAGTYEILVPASSGVGLPLITTTVVLQGAGSAQTIIKRAAGAPMFSLLNIGSASTLKGITLSGGRTGPGSAGSTMIGQAATPLVLEDVVISGSRGGAAWWPAVGKVTQCRFVDNEGAIESRFDNASPLTIEDSIFEDNVAGSRGALIVVGPTTIRRSIFRGNGVLAGSGGAVAGMGTLAIVDSLFQGNQASNEGGAVVGSGTLEISGSTFVANAAGYGGAVSLDGGKLLNTTFSGNDATVYGGALYIRGGTTATLNNVTLTDNESQQRGGGLWKGGGSVLLVSNSVIAGNGAGNGPDCYVDNGALVSSGGYNFIGLGAACGLVAGTGDEVGTGTPLDPKLSPLGDHGGKLHTHAPLAGSPLVDQGYPGSGNGKPCEATDQIGTARPVGAACDIGAFEGELEGGGAGGAGGDGAGGGGAGSSDEGGAGSGGDATGSGATGGDGASSAGADGNPQGGRPSSGGSHGTGAGADKSAGGEGDGNGEAGAGSPSGSGSGSESAGSSGGCGCRVGGGSAASSAALALLIAAAALGARRRRALR